MAVKVVLAIAIFGKGFLPITVIGLLALVALIQIVEDFSQSRPTTRLSEPEISTTTVYLRILFILLSKINCSLISASSHQYLLSLYS